MNKTNNTTKSNDRYSSTPIKQKRKGAYDTIAKLEKERRGKKIQRKK